MAWRVIDAELVKIDERTDVRERLADCDDEDLAILEEWLDDGRARIEPGLLGWGGHNVTLRCEDGACYHARVEEV